MYNLQEDWQSDNNRTQTLNKLNNTKCGIPSQEGQSWSQHFSPWPKMNKGSSSHHQQFTYEVWKWLGKNCSLYHHHAHNVSQADCQRRPWPFTPWAWPKINMINRVPLIIIHTWSLKVIGLKLQLCIVPTRFYTQKAKVYLDLLRHDPKSKGFLLSQPTTYIWSLKVIGQKLKSLSCQQGFTDRVLKLTLTFEPVD